MRAFGQLTSSNKYFSKQIFSAQRLKFAPSSENETFINSFEMVKDNMRLFVEKIYTEHFSLKLSVLKFPLKIIFRTNL